MEPNCIDCVITSPPYFREREKNKHFNLNQSLDSYIETIVEFSKLVWRVLKEKGSFWLNISDSFSKCSLQLIPSKIAIKLMENGWILNNDIVWNKPSCLPTSYGKRLTNSYEHFYHFAKSKNFYYNITSLDAKKNVKFCNGENYIKRIDNSILSTEQKENAKKEVSICVKMMNAGEINDFRLLLKGINKVTSKNRLKEIDRKGFSIIKSVSNKPTDVWEIPVEKESFHYAPFPEELVQLPIKVTCPKNGVILDPFCGSGTTNFVSMNNYKKSIGIDINEDFIEYAKKDAFNYEFPVENEDKKQYIYANSYCIKHTGCGQKFIHW